MVSLSHARAVGWEDTSAWRGDLAGFRQELYRSFTARADVLFELTDAVLCADGPVRSLVELTLLAEHRRGHGAMYDALNQGRVEPERLRRALASLPLPTAADGRIVLAVDVSPWLRPDAPTSSDRLFCHVYGRARNTAQLIPGWPYSFVAALETGRTSWTALLDAVRLGPADDPTAVTADQLRAVIDRLITAGHWQPGDPDIVVVADAGYDITRLAHVLADLPIELVGRLRSDRVLRLPKPPRSPGTTGRPPKHGPEIALDKPATWPEPQHTTNTQTTRYGTAMATSWDRVHPRLTRRACWLDYTGQPPVIEGALIRLQVQHLPGDRTRSRYGCGPRSPTPPRTTWIAGGRRSCAASIWSTRFDCSSRPWAGPLRRSAPRRQPTAGPGWWPPHTLSCVSPARWHKTFVALGRNPPRPADSPRHGSAADSGTSARRPHSQPAHPNPPDQDQDAHSAPTTRQPAPHYDVGKTVKRDRTVTAHQQATG